MTFTDSITTVLRKYAVFRGRARRSEFWWFTLFSTALSAVAWFLDTAVLRLDPDSWLNIENVLGLALFLPTVAVGARRLHDRGRSGWWQLIGLIPVLGTIPLIVMLAREGHDGSNDFGPDPRALPAAGPQDVIHRSEGPFGR